VKSGTGEPSAAAPDIPTSTPSYLFQLAAGLSVCLGLVEYKVCSAGRFCLGLKSTSWPYTSEDLSHPKSAPANKEVLHQYAPLKQFITTKMATRTHKTWQEELAGESVL
jgi:hypothetical protein